VSGPYIIQFTKRSAADLRAIFDYIRGQSPQNASTYLRKMMTAIDSLEQFPYRYRALARGRSRAGTRMLIVWPYLIYYRILEATRIVRVLAIRHGARQRPRRF
jgi:addiction module RelE/StbE family toxin